MHNGGGSILPTEEPHFSKKEIAENYRLGCQVKVKEDMKISIPEEVFGVKKWEATVVSNYNVASFIKEFIVEIPDDMPYEAGGYIQIEIPDCEINYSDIDITAHPMNMMRQKNSNWSGINSIYGHLKKNDEEVARAYSMAFIPLKEDVMLNVRVATPPWDRAKNAWSDVNQV